jgi:hypothetical protein
LHASTSKSAQTRIILRIAKGPFISPHRITRQFERLLIGDLDPRSLMRLDAARRVALNLEAMRAIRMIDRRTAVDGKPVLCVNFSTGARSLPG